MRPRRCTKTANASVLRGRRSRTNSLTRPGSKVLNLSRSRPLTRRSLGSQHNVGNRILLSSTKGLSRSVSHQALHRQGPDLTIRGCRPKRAKLDSMAGSKSQSRQRIKGSLVGHNSRANRIPVSSTRGWSEPASHQDRRRQDQALISRACRQRLAKPVSIAAWSNHDLCQHKRARLRALTRVHRHPCQPHRP